MALMPVKLCVIGPYGVGKTTFVRAISETPVVETEVRTPVVEEGKTTTTVGIDFGTVKIGDSYELLIFGVPGQVRFESVWKTSLSGARAAVILLDVSHEKWRGELTFYQE
jgi:uncharacterized protein